ncbi:unnamed protein product [Miscanthus lutarioriparius]|uniref:Uncharacterized protein n=1 Tax=Miscanthus lutarioriparius TaxID=422564 RepID=A0A811QD56_9POAL|nr:unnamed protein product [Miscanthus lutarioriparius]
MWIKSSKHTPLGYQQEIPCLDDMLGVEPLEMHFPFELDLQISRSIELTNDTEDYIAFMTKARLRRFRIEPDKGIDPPRSKCSVIDRIIRSYRGCEECRDRRLEDGGKVDGAGALWYSTTVHARCCPRACVGRRQRDHVGGP